MFLFSFKLRRTLSVLIMTVGFLLYGQSALACLCETFGSPRKDFDYAKQKAKSVFVGRVVQVENVIAHGSWSEKQVTLEVERYWKGHVNRRVVVFTGRNDCETRFEVGEEYLVLAYVPDGERDLYTDHCMGSGLLRLSADSLKWLGEGKRAQTSRAKHNTSLDASGGSVFLN
jgi:hypothetical protein